MSGPDSKSPGAPPPESERELDEIRQAWAGGFGDEPPAELDLAILRSARRAAAPEPRSRFRAWPWTRGWAHNLATVAVVAIAVTLLLQLNGERDRGAGPAGSPPLLQDTGVNDETADGYDRDLRLESDPPAAPSAARSGQTLSTRRVIEEEAAPAERAEAMVPAAKAEQSAEENRAAQQRILSREQQPPAPAAMSADTLSDAAESEMVRRLRELEALLAAGDEEAYRQALVAFRADYPDYPLPDHLQP